MRAEAQHVASCFSGDAIGGVAWWKKKVCQPDQGRPSEKKGVKYGLFGNLEVKSNTAFSILLANIDTLDKQVCDDTTVEEKFDKGSARENISVEGRHCKALFRCCNTGKGDCRTWFGYSMEHRLGLVQNKKTHHKLLKDEAT